jgi:hypothetical protein
MKNQRDIPKTIFAAVAAVYFLSCAYNPAAGSFFDFVNLPIHETGHLLFAPFGHFVSVAGGSLFQVIVPLVFFGYFVWHGKPFSAAMVLFWVGQSILNVYVYANDAVVMQLVLLGGYTGSEGSFHDWNFLLTETGLIDSTKTVAGLIRFLGTATIFAAAIGAFLYAAKGEKILTEKEL